MSWKPCTPIGTLALCRPGETPIHLERYVAAAFQETAPHAVVLGSSDALFSTTRWVTHVLKIRPVRYVDIVTTRFPWGAELASREISDFPRAFSHAPPWRLTVEQRLMRATQALGDQPPALDAREAVLRREAADHWTQLCARFETQGDDQGANRCHGESLRWRGL